MLDEKDFQRKADAAFEDLKRRMLAAGDEHGSTSKANPENWKFSSRNPGRLNS